MTKALAQACPETDSKAFLAVAKNAGYHLSDITTLPRTERALFTVIVPTRNERGNIAALLERLSASGGDDRFEVLFVDDSSDGTPEAIRDHAHASGLAVRLLHRPEGHRQGGLSGAVVAGLKHARGEWAVVMDGDLQHPPELAAKLVAVGRQRGLDLVAGSRYQGSGSAEGLDGGYRHSVSSVTTRLVKLVFPRRLSRLSDPMSGFFAVRLAALQLASLDPIGFKILLEIAVRQTRLTIAEVPFSFGARLAEQSKAGTREGLRFARHLMRLRLLVLTIQLRRSASGSRRQRLLRMLAFGLVGVSGLGVNTAALWALSHGAVFRPHYLIAAILATEVSTAWNLLLTETVVFRGQKPKTLLGRATRFYLLNHLALVLRLPLLALLVERFSVSVLIANLLTLILMFAVRFLVADSAIYAPAEAGGTVADKQPMRITVDLTNAGRLGNLSRDKHASSGQEGRPKAMPSRYLPYRYAIDGVMTVGSQVPLKELEYFRAQWVGQDVDLAVRIGQVGRSGPRARAVMTQYTSPPGLSYQEHLGRLGANFTVTIGEPVEVVCSPMLAASPHVLYTNVIEALLRFLSVSRGVILLHSACLELDGTGLLLSARTDTGKTGSVLRLIREYGAQFLSDDMTIIDPQGNATCFPKPLTISHHTLRAVQAGDLSPAEWRRLKVQSRLHSKEGRQFGMALANMNIPIMGVNSLTQRIVPPPKYNVDRLVDCTVVRHTQVQQLFIIERGTPTLADLPFEETVQTLVENTDDAYGFPPFRQMAPSIVIGEDDYADLRAKERTILRAAMGSIRARRLASDNFTWAEDISRLLKADDADRPAPVPPEPGRQAPRPSLADLPRSATATA